MSVLGWSYFLRGDGREREHEREHEREYERGARARQCALAPISRLSDFSSCPSLKARPGRPRTQNSRARQSSDGRCEPRGRREGAVPQGAPPRTVVSAPARRPAPRPSPAPPSGRASWTGRVRAIRPRCGPMPFPTPNEGVFNRSDRQGCAQPFRQGGGGPRAASRSADAGGRCSPHGRGSRRGRRRAPR